MKFDDEYIETLIELGALVDRGVDSSGTHVVVPTEHLRVLDPEFYAIKRDYMGLGAMHLWMEGFVDIRAYTAEDGSYFTIKILPKAYDKFEISKLSQELQDDLEQFKIILGGK